jgi:hypothetical protein
LALPAKQCVGREFFVQFYSGLRCIAANCRSSSRRCQRKWPSPNTSSFSSNLKMSTDRGPVCRHETAKCDGSSLRPSGRQHPPFRAWEMQHVTPETFAIRVFKMRDTDLIVGRNQIECRANAIQAFCYCENRHCSEENQGDKRQFQLRFLLGSKCSGLQLAFEMLNQMLQIVR